MPLCGVRGAALKDTVCVIGAGPAGMMAAGMAYRPGNRVVLLEKNAVPGKKLLLTGKGRCNVTNSCGLSELMENIVRNPRFLYSAFSAFPPQSVMEFFEARGVPLKTERGQRVFPVSDRAADINNALRAFVAERGVELVRGEAAALEVENGAVCGVRLSEGRVIRCAAAVLATGGLSYPRTGSTGDGYRMAADLSHTICRPGPSLVPLETEEKWTAGLAGLTLKNCAVKLVDSSAGREIYSDFGELLFTHFGVSGPVVLSASAHMEDTGRYRLLIDLKPALRGETLDRRLLHDFAASQNRDFKNSLDGLLPKSLIPIIIGLSGVRPDTKINSVTKAERAALVRLLKSLPLTVRGFRPVEEAVVTRGGVCVREVDPRTMESRLCRGLYFAGEILDVDAYTGGFNLQIAFSTGYLAGRAAGGA